MVLKTRVPCVSRAIVVMPPAGSVLHTISRLCTFDWLCDRVGSYCASRAKPERR